MRRIACCLLLVVVALSASSTAAADPVNAWTMNGPPNAAESAIAVSKSSPGTVYLGDNTGGVWRSRDDGESWVDASPPDSSTNTSPAVALAVSLSDADIVIATRGCHMWASMDGGDTWQVPTGLPAPAICYGAYPVTFDTTGAAWALIAGGLYMSSDNGVDWTLAGSPPNSTGAPALAIAPGAPQVIWVGTRAGTVVTSSDGGSTWQDHSNGLPTPLGAGLQQLVVDPAQPAMAYVLDAGEVYSTSSGSWAAAFPTPPDGAVSALAIAPGTPETVIVADGSGLGRSTDGGQTWSGLDVASAREHPGFVLTVDPTNPSSVWLGSYGLFHSTDAGAHVAWVSDAGRRGSLNTILADPNDDQRLYAGTDSDGVLRSDDGGRTWQATGDELVGQVRGLTADPYTPDTVLAIASGGLYRSADDGDTWEASDSGLPNGVDGAVAADPDAAGIFYAEDGDLVYRSTDHGRTWNACGVPGSKTRIQDVAVDPSNDAIVWAVSVSGIYRSSDSCSDWTTVSSDYADVVSVGPDGTAYVGAERGMLAFASGSDTPTASSAATGYDMPTLTEAVTADPDRAGVAYAGTSQGTYETVDGGHRWAHLTTNGLASMWSLDILVSGHTIRTATTSGIATIHLDGPTATTDGAQLADTTITFAGTGDPSGQDAQAFFEYGPTTGYGQTTTPADIGAGADPVPVSARVTGTHYTTYHYRLVVVSGDGIAIGDDRTISIPPLPALVSASPATGIGPYVATVNGTVDPSGPGATYHFEWGTTTGYGASTADSQLAPSASNMPVSATLEGLSPNTTYHYRVVATTIAGTVVGPDATFRTFSLTLPNVWLGQPTEVGFTTATLNATVAPGNSDATYHFEWGTTSFDASSPDSVLTASRSSSLVSFTVAGLTAGTTYHWRVVATNAAGTSSPDYTFQTTPLTAPQISLGSPTGIGLASATLNGTVDPGNTDSTYYFEWGPTTSYGFTTPAGQLAADTAPTAVSALLPELSPGTTYHYRLVAGNEGGVTDGRDATFRTGDRPPVMVSSGTAHLAAGQIQHGRVPLHLAWAAQAGDAPICSYAVTRSAPAPTKSLPAPTAARANDLEAPGTLRYTVRATGCDGEQSNAVTTPAQQLALLQETAAPLGYRGSWKTVAGANASGGHMRRTTVAGSRLAYTFTGRAVALVAPMCAACSAIRVRVDGAPAKEIVLHSSSLMARTIHPLASFGAVGRHTVTITAIARDGHTRVDIDDLIRLG
jgi:photosystem II stability/assembly factor-like uncharacterized protein